MSCFVNSLGSASFSLYATALGPYTLVGQPLTLENVRASVYSEQRRYHTCSVATAPGLSHGATVLALRPAWAI